MVAPLSSTRPKRQLLLQTLSMNVLPFYEGHELPVDEEQNAFTDLENGVNRIAIYCTFATDVIAFQCMISSDQVTALAPDAASFKAGKALAVRSKWSDLGHQEQMIWGHALGSGNKPYKTQVDISEFAYKCSCPSRKFPCKHALGLMFLAADDASDFKDSQQPDWVQEWVATRQEKQEKKQQKKKSAKPKSPDAVAKTKKKRESRVEEGVSFLQNFLLDLIRQGLGQAEIRELTYWDSVSRRLIDCQAPGLASAVGRLGNLAAFGSTDDTRLLHELGALYLLTHSYGQKSELSKSQQSEVDQRIGWQIARQDVLNNQTVKDDWFVAFRTITKPAQITVYSTWVTGSQSNEWALLLSFGAAGSAPSALWPVGSTVSTELAFYPGANPERALPVDDTAAAKMNLPCVAKAEKIDDLLSRVSSSLHHNPWRTRFPFLLCAQPTRSNNQSVLVDEDGHALPWRAVGDQQMVLTTVCGGKPSLLAGEWDGYHCHLHAADDGGSWFSLREQYT